MTIGKIAQIIIEEDGKLLVQYWIENAVLQHHTVVESDDMKKEKMKDWLHRFSFQKSSQTAEDSI